MPIKKEKLRDKVLRRSGLKTQHSKKKKGDDSSSALSGASKETQNSVERRRDEEIAKTSVQYAMA